MPELKLTLAQIVLGTIDVAAAAAALYVLLPIEPSVPFAHFLAAYVVAVAIGFVSHVPGGVAVFEAIMLIALPSVFISGAVLLFSNSTPALKSRLEILREALPLAFVEVSHLLARYRADVDCAC